MGNTSIGHSKYLAHGDDNPFAVIFDPAEVEEGLEIPVEDIRITEDTLFPGLANPAAVHGDLLSVCPALHRRQPGLPHSCQELR